MQVMEMVQGQDTSSDSSSSYDDRQIIFYASGSNFSSPTGITANPLVHGEVFIANSAGMGLESGMSSGEGAQNGEGAILRVTPLAITSYPTPYPTPDSIHADDDSAVPSAHGADDDTPAFTKRIYSLSLQDIMLLTLGAALLISGVMYATYRRTQYVASSPSPHHSGRRRRPRGWCAACGSSCCSIFSWCLGRGYYRSRSGSINERTPLFTPLQMLASPLLEGREYTPPDRFDDRELQKLMRRYDKADWLLQPEHAKSRLKVL
jgi:hypothetical protein